MDTVVIKPHDLLNTKMVKVSHRKGAGPTATAGVTQGPAGAVVMGPGSRD